MKKMFSFLFLGLFFLSFGFVGATELVDNQLVDQLNSGSTEISEVSLKFSQAKSCDSIQEMLKKYAKDKPNYRGGRAERSLTNGLSSEIKGGDEVSVSFEADLLESDGGIVSSSTDYSTTNLQKKGVDEPELIKTDGKYFYYYNSRLNKVSIVSSPLDIDSSVLVPSNVKVIKEIAVPRGLNNVELFVNEGRLVLVGDYWAQGWNNDYLFNGSRTILAVYDISDVYNLKLLKFENIPGSYQDSRLIDNQLYIISQQGLNWYNWPDYDFNIAKGLSSVEVTDGGTELKTVDCSNISYVLPEDDDLKLNPVFTIVTALNIKDTARDIETTALLSPSGQIHMSKNSLYIASNYYTPVRWSCPRGLFCTTSLFGGTTQTLVHKFKRNGLALKYENTALVQGYLLNQYSMDEDNNGNFRILTKVRDNEEFTNLYVLDKNFNLAGKLENIEPGEEFKTSRYIGDKLYLVTFQQIDPLFVIDVADIKNPKIIGELKIPGYSTYLHPLKVSGTKQYLLGLGYSTADNGYGGVINSGVKLSLFEVDYSVKDEKDFISVKELDSITQGGKGSSSEALNNPRLFVMDKDYNVTLPLNLKVQINDGQNCSVRYDDSGKEVEKNCYPITREAKQFVGLKTFNVSEGSGITEVFSKNYLVAESLSGVLKNNYYLSNMRVGYVGDALYAFNSLFADFIYPNDTSTTILFK